MMSHILFNKIHKTKNKRKKKEVEINNKYITAIIIKLVSISYVCFIMRLSHWFLIIQLSLSFSILLLQLMTFTNCPIIFNDTFGEYKTGRAQLVKH